MVQKAIVLVGGFGTRLRPLSCTRPKALFPVANVPLLERVVRALAEGGVEEIVLAVNYQADLIEAKLGGGEKFSIRIKYSREKHLWVLLGLYGMQGMSLEILGLFSC